MATQTIGGAYEFGTDDASLLGIGGMGKVIRGTNIHTQQTVAIKELKPEIVKENPDHVERFAREAEALSRLNHPNIVNVLDTINEGGMHYIVMEYVGGGSLRDLLDEKTLLPIDRVLQIALDLADALTRAHRLRIIHRDIKPANVLLAEDGTPRLTDFGVARIEDKTGVTKTGTVVGTLNYLSPEALNSQRIDERADIWAFGIMLYEMLAGQRPFEEDTVGGLITAILTHSAPDIRELRPDVPDALANLINNMLKKDPDERIDSVRKVGLELENVIRGVDSDEIIIDDDLRQAVIDAEASRFASSTSNMSFQVTKAFGAGGMTEVKDADGQEFVVVPKGAFRQRVLIAGLGIAVAVIIGLAFFTNLFGINPRNNAEDRTASNLNAEAISQVGGVADNEYMVLVANLVIPADVDADAAPIQDTMIEGLSEILERDVPFSNIRIRKYDDEIRNNQEAIDVAEAVGAAVVIWGFAVDRNVNLNIQIGSLEQFETNAFERETLENLLNIEITGSADGQQQRNITPFIVGMLGTLHAANGDVFELSRTFAILDEIGVDNVPDLALSGQGTDVNLYTYFVNYLTDTDAAIQAMNDALEIDGGNALLYAFRSLAYVRAANYSAALTDATTAERIGPDEWAVVAVLRAISTDSLESATALMEEALTYRPDDWFYHAILGEILYASGDMDSALISIEQSIDHQPEANYPYILGIIINMRLGNISQAGEYMQAVVLEFPDPSFGNRIFEATFGAENNINGLLYSAIGNLLIGQYQAALDDSQEVIDTFVQDGEVVSTFEFQGAERTYMADLALYHGLAQCNMGNMTAAQATYTAGLRVDPDYAMLYLLQAEVYKENGRDRLAESAMQEAMGTSEELDILVEDSRDGLLSCTNFFDYFLNFDERVATNDNA